MELKGNLNHKFQRCLSVEDYDDSDYNISSDEDNYSDSEYNYGNFKWDNFELAWESRDPNYTKNKERHSLFEELITITNNEHRINSQNNNLNLPSNISASTNINTFNIYTVMLHHAS